MFTSNFNNRTYSDTIVLGICGPAGAGKSTVANLVSQYFGPSYSHTYPLATPIKEACKIIFDWDDNMVEEHPLKEATDERFDVSPRRAMRLLGTEWRDMINTDLWLLRMEAELAKQNELWNDSPSKGSRVFLIPDVRFDHEADFIRSYANSYLLEVRSPNTSYSQTHASEMGVSKNKIDLVLDNTGDKRDLADDVVEALWILDIFPYSQLADDL